MSISSQDENWLDHEATSSGFWTLWRELQTTRGVWRVVDDAEKGVVRKLREVAGDLSKLVRETYMFVIPESINNEVNQIRLEESYSMTSTCLTDYFSHR